MGTVYLSEQTEGFLLAIVLGAFLSLFYTALKTIIVPRYVSDFTVVLSDILFWCVATLLSFMFMIIFAKGDVRGYIVFGEIVGFLIFKETVSKYFAIFLRHLIKLLKSIFRVILIPFRKFYKILMFLLLKIKSILKKVAEFAKKLLKDVRRLLYNLLKIKQKNKTKDDKVGHQKKR